jgi:Xaa-Pro aminopeptidase
MDGLDAEGGFFAKRLERLQAKLRDVGLDAAVIMSPVNLYYFTGTAQRAALLVPSRGEATLYVLRSYERALRESHVKCVEASGLNEVAERLASMRAVGFEEDRLPVKLHRRMAKGVKSLDVSEAIMELRAVKDELEQRLMRRAVRQCDAALEEAERVLGEGVSAVEAAAKIEAVLRGAGHDGYLDMRSWGDRMPNLVVLPPGDVEPGRIAAVSVGVGVSSACPVGPSARRMRRGDAVLIDVSGRFKGYTSNVTRTFVIGRASREVEEAFEAVKAVHREALRRLRAGADAGEVYRVCIQLAAELGYSEGFMGRGRGKVAFIGHGLGLEVDEPPAIGEGGGVKLKEGMVLAVEPKIVGGQGWGVGLESTILLRSGGCEVLERFPQELIEV